MLNIIDTAGQEGYANILDNHIRNSQFFVVTFALDSKESYEHAKELREYILRVKDREGDAQMVLVGNKLDLITDNPELRQVSKADAETIAAQWKVYFISNRFLILRLLLNLKSI